MSDLKIFISCHKKSKVAEREFLYPIQVGACYAKDRIESFLHDDEGDNISEKNKKYCELTAQYYVWKNIEADYYGFFHYRRYFNFNLDKNLKEDAWGSVVYDKIDEAVIEELSIDEKKIKDLFKEYDILTTKKRDLSKAPGANKGITVYKEYIKQEHQHEKDLKKLLEVIKYKYPEFEEIADAYMNGDKAYECNMFIMKKDIFYKYSAWLFEVLFEVEKYIDFSTYNIEETRVMGFLAERACGIYIEYLKSKGSRVAELQKTIFMNTDVEEKVEILDIKSIPIVLAANNKFAPYMSIFIKSLALNNINNKIDIFVLHQDITADTKNRIIKDNPYSNIKIKFIDVKTYFANFKLYIDQHLSLETYFRLVIQNIFKDYSKVLYLDSDMIVLQDIRELYEMDMQDMAIAGVKDIEYAGACKTRIEPVKYAKDVLKLDNEYDYIQAGVLIFNLDKMRKLYSVEELLKIASSYKWKHHDQDVLNFAYRGNIKHIPQEWNVMMNWEKKNISRMDILKKAPLSLYEEYTKARQNPKIVHFAGYQKPWNEESCDYAEFFWEYARKSIYYEYLLSGLSSKAKNKRAKNITIKDDIYDLFGSLFPLYSKRRDVIRRIYRSFIH